MGGHSYTVSPEAAGTARRPRETLARLSAAVAADGYRVRSCGTCANFRPSGPSYQVSGGWAGYCTWAREHQAKSAAFTQLLLSAPCDQYAPEEADKGGRSREEPTAGGTSLTLLPEGRGSTFFLPPALPVVTPVRREEKGGWRTWWRRLRGKHKDSGPGPFIDDEIALVERSGKRPGTVPCPTCSGRIANWGALNTVTERGDTRTFSVWRCRQCLAYFLEDWVDAWVRTDSLETVERLYRLAPAEATAALAQIARCPHPSPQERHLLTPEKTWFAEFVAAREPLRAAVRHAGKPQ
ncbi:MAG: hypothetical protein IT330_03085 [Anaerolineae bacterium]|nr:hypothetical protein [Anaerolineae bacterium]